MFVCCVGALSRDDGKEKCEWPTANHKAMKCITIESGQQIMPNSIRMEKIYPENVEPSAVFFFSSTL